MVARERSKELVRVGIDIGATTLQVAIVCRGKLFERSYPNTTVGHADIVRRLSSYKSEIRVCAEATGAYGLDLFKAIADASVALMVINPRAAAHYAKAAMRRAKTDRVDAAGLADLAGRDDFKPWTAPSQAVFDLRAAARRIGAIKDLIVVEKNRLKAATATNQTPNYVLVDIEDNIAALEARADKMAKHALELARGDATLARGITILDSVPGIGAASAVVLFAELAVLPKEMTAKQVVAFAGLDPRPKESGTSVRGRRPISRQGSSRLRKALYFPALTAGTQKKGPLMDAYDGLIARGKKPMIAVVALMRRMLSISWTLLRRDELFDVARFGKRAETP